MLRKQNESQHPESVRVAFRIPRLVPTMLSQLRELHSRNALLIIFSVLACGLWGVGNHWRGQPMSRAYLLALAGVEMLMALQAFMGTEMAFSGLRPSSILHLLLYGPLSLLALPGAYVYTRRQKTQRLPLVFGLTCLLLFGLSIRASFTG